VMEQWNQGEVWKKERKQAVKAIIPLQDEQSPLPLLLKPNPLNTVRRRFKISQNTLYMKSKMKQ